MEDRKMRFDGKVTLITGGGTGIGAATARRIVAEGGKVILMGRRREPLEQVAKPIGGLVVNGDAASAEDVQKAVGLAKREFGGIDLLIACAGGHDLGSALETDDNAWAQATRLNLNTAFVSAREALPTLIERKGNIVIISSIAGLFAGPEVVGYVTMKHALIGLTRSLARDYGRAGVRVNAVCPGWVRTPMSDEQMEVLVAKHNLDSVEDAYKLATADVPLQRAADPEEVANVICFLASSEASMVSGTYLMVDGGASAVDLPTLAFVR